jgi:hypothetical protein
MRGLNENIPIQDIFCSGLGAIELLEGGCVRFYLYVSQMADAGEETDRVVAARIVMPLEAVPDAVQRTINATAAAQKAIPIVGRRLH